MKAVCQFKTASSNKRPFNNALYAVPSIGWQDATIPDARVRRWHQWLRERCKFVQAKLRESFCPAAASHSRPRQAGAYQTARTNLHLSVDMSAHREVIFLIKKLLCNVLCQAWLGVGTYTILKETLRESLICCWGSRQLKISTGVQMIVALKLKGYLKTHVLLFTPLERSRSKQSHHDILATKYRAAT